MSSKQRQAEVLALAMQFVGCLCAVMLAICAALALTVQREGHYAASLQKGDYFAYAQQAALTNCTRQAQQAGFAEEPLESRITLEAVRAGVLHRADALWHGATQDNTSPLEDLSREYEDRYGRDAAASLLLEMNCEEQWYNATVAPFSALLSSVLQYKRVVQLVGWLCALLLAVCGVMQFLLAGNWEMVKTGVQRMAVGAAAACVVLGAGLYFGTGWQSWMLQTDPAYASFCAWFGAFPPVLAVCGVVLAAIMCKITKTMKNLTK